MHPVTEELCNKARALGLDSLTEGHLAQFYANAAGWTHRDPPGLSDSGSANGDRREKMTFLKECVDA